MTLPDKWVDYINILTSQQCRAALLECVAALRQADMLRYRDAESVYEYPYEPPTLYWESNGDPLVGD